MATRGPKKRKSVLYPVSFVPKTITKFHNWRGKECLLIWDFSEGEQNYILSGEMDGYEAMKLKLKEAEAEKKPIKIMFVKKSGKRFVNQVL